MLVLGMACTTPWKELQSRYQTNEVKPPGSEEGKDVVLSATEYRGCFSYRGNVTMSFDSDRVYLALTGPNRFMNEPVSIPLAAITGCSRIQWNPGWETALWLAEPRTELAFKDDDDKVFNWCKAHNIPLMDRPTAIRLLYPDSNKAR
jgi:hypothetical protein